jgi:hypothetical protein
MNEKRAWLEGFLSAAADAARFTISGGQPASSLAEALGPHWHLIILAIEIDLQVELPDRLADGHGVSLDRFVDRVLALRTKKDPFWTFSRLHALAGAYEDRIRSLQRQIKKESAGGRRGPGKVTPRRPSRKR